MEKLIKFSEFLSAIGVDIDQFTFEEAISLMKEAEKLAKGKIKPV